MFTFPCNSAQHLSNLESIQKLPQCYLYVIYILSWKNAGMLFQSKVVSSKRHWYNLVVLELVSEGDTKRATFDQRKIKSRIY